MAPFVLSEEDQIHSDFPVKGKLSDGANNTGIDRHYNLDPAYQITEMPIGSRRQIKVVCMGAGYSGVMMGIVFSQKMQGAKAELVIYERNEDIGGTWLENR